VHPEGGEPKPPPQPRRVHAGKGEKSSGYGPIVEFEILESGEVARAHIKRASGIAEIDAFALNSVQSVKYNHRPGCGVVETEASVTVDF